MPWQEQSHMSLRREFVTFAQQDAVSMRSLCRQFGISPKTGYKWVTRAQTHPEEGLADRSRRPHASPGQTAEAVETAVVAVRDAHPTWGGRKVHHWLQAHGHDPVPAPSTITDILRRHGRLPAEPVVTRRWQRFERAAPNALWQLDFMGHRPLARGRVHPLTLLDDHSRFLLGLWACGHEQLPTVQAHLTAAFRRYGLPAELLTDNGPPWAATAQGGITRLEAWLIQLGITVVHGRPYHPQTQGKVERIHATIANDCLTWRRAATLAEAQRDFDHFRETYNFDRPHEALAYAVPSSRYTPAPTPFPETLPPIIYPSGEQVRKVRGQGAISYHGRSYYVGTGLIGQPVAVRPTTTDGVLAVYFCHQQIKQLDLRVTV